MFCCLRTCLNHHPTRKPTVNVNRKPEIHLDDSHMGPEVILLSNQLRITGCGGSLATAPLVQSKSYFEVKIQQSGIWSVGLATRQTDLSRKFGGGDKESWCLCSDNATRHNNEEFRPVVATTIDQTSVLNNGTVTNVTAEVAASGLIGMEDVQEDVLLTMGTINSQQDAVIVTEPKRHLFPDEGDIIGIAFDHVELNFYFNGKNLEVPFRNVRGAVYPVVYVGDGATLDIILEKFHHVPPSGFDKIMLEQSLL